MGLDNRDYIRNDPPKGPSSDSGPPSWFSSLIQRIKRAFRSPRPSSGSNASHQHAEHNDHLEGDVDRILDKISSKGIESLTDKEKKLLEQVSDRYKGWDPDVFG